MAWLFLASPAPLSAATNESASIEIRNGTRTQNLARLTRNLLSLEGYHVTLIGNHIDFGADATIIYYRDGEENLAQTLKSKIFPWAQIEESIKLRNGVDIKVLLGHDLLMQPHIMARIFGDETVSSPQAPSASTSGPGPPPRLVASKGPAAPVIDAAMERAEQNWPARQAQSEALASSPSVTSGGIQSRTDKQGVIHIGNVAPSQATPGLPENPGTVPEARTAQAELPAPAIQQPIHQIKETSTPEADADPIKKVCQVLAQNASAYDVNGIIAAAAQVAAKKEAANDAVDYNYLPVMKVSQARNQDFNPLMIRGPAAPKTADAGAAAGIRNYRDERGVLHICNAAPGIENLAPALQMAQSSQIQGGRTTPPAKPETPNPRPPIRQVAWKPDERHLALLPITSSGKKALISRPGLIRHYRDSKGMVHITNVDPAPSETLPPASLMAKNRAADRFASQGGQVLSALAANQGGWAIRPAAWNGEDGLKLWRRAKATAAQTAEVVTEGGIRRYRDKRGVIHIKTVEYPLPPGVVLPSRQASTSLLASTASAPNLSGTATTPQPADHAAFRGAGATVTAYKDAKGRLRITTALPQPAPGNNYSPLPFHAELEPFIQEAAQMHRLPPTLIKAVIKVESNFCSWAVSPKGAMGLMQLMPGTANLLGVREPFDPRENILGGCRYLRMLVNLFGGNLPLALASYNAGFQRVVDCGYQIPSIKETQDFVAAVMGRYVAEEKRGRLPWT
ncbi:MAG: transglycosylase SLT domain-containing protein [Deltaproteobacteria bacterium]|nr:transglycosylase SLT domain-containing protein [Deltaproteobacteria bacterium]